MDIVGYDGYIIYDDGRVYSKKSNKFLKPKIHRLGYIVFQLFRNGKVCQLYQHRLIALHYIPNPDNKLYIDHINREPDDNRKVNLKWVTHQENMKNKSVYESNKSGHKYIKFYEDRSRWVFYKDGKTKRFKNKIDCICWKFIYIYWLRHHA